MAAASSRGRHRFKQLGVHRIHRTKEDGQDQNGGVRDIWPVICFPETLDSVFGM